MSESSIRPRDGFMLFNFWLKLWDGFKLLFCSLFFLEAGGAAASLV